MTPDIYNLILAGQADLDAASRYRCLADHNPSLAREYRRRATLAEALGKQKLDDAGQRITALAATETTPTLQANNKGGDR